MVLCYGGGGGGGGASSGMQKGGRRVKLLDKILGVSVGVSSGAQLAGNGIKKQKNIEMQGLVVWWVGLDLDIVFTGIIFKIYAARGPRPPLYISLFGLAQERHKQG